MIRSCEITLLIFDMIIYTWFFLAFWYILLLYQKELTCNSKVNVHQIRSHVVRSFVFSVYTDYQVLP